MRITAVVDQSLETITFQPLDLSSTLGKQCKTNEMIQKPTSFVEIISCKTNEMMAMRGIDPVTSRGKAAISDHWAAYLLVVEFVEDKLI